MEFVPLWTDILDGPNWKILDLPPDLYRFWTFCLIAAQKHDFVEGFLPDARTLSRWFGMSVEEVELLRDGLVACRILDRMAGAENDRDVTVTGAGHERDMSVTGPVTCHKTGPKQERDDCVFKIHDWAEWRAVNDPTAGKRKRAQRAKRKRVAETVTETVTDMSRNGHEPVTDVSGDVTPQNDRRQKTEEDNIPHPHAHPREAGTVVDEVVTFGRETLRDRFDLESLGENLRGWRAAKYPDPWIMDAILVANANAKPGGMAAYIAASLRKWKAKGGPDPEEVAKARPATPEFTQAPEGWNKPRKGKP